MSLKAIFPDMEVDLRSSSLRRERAADSLKGAPLDAPREPARPAFTPVPPGSYTAAAVILLTDGQSNVGPDPVEAARMAAERGVRVFTVGVGTAEGETPPSAGSASSRWGWARPRARPCASRAGPCACAWTRRPSRRSPT